MTDAELLRACAIARRGDCPDVMHEIEELPSEIEGDGRYTRSLEERLLEAQWQSIESAPRDGTVFYIDHPRGIRRAWWASDRLYYEAPGRGEMVDDAIAHWMSMPEPPK